MEVEAPKVGVGAAVRPRDMAVLLWTEMNVIGPTSALVILSIGRELRPLNIIWLPCPQMGDSPSRESFLYTPLSYSICNGQCQLQLFSSLYS